jgi:hypothetical protein
MTNLAEVNAELRPDAPDECNHPPHHSPTEITDTVEVMRNWNWRSEVPEEIEKADLDDQCWERGYEPPYSLTGEEFVVPHPTTIRHEGSRVGRNDPCPCGSGKKYKKCCLR